MPPSGCVLQQQARVQGRANPAEVRSRLGVGMNLGDDAHVGSSAKQQNQRQEVCDTHASGGHLESLRAPPPPNLPPLSEERSTRTALDVHRLFATIARPLAVQSRTPREAREAHRNPAVPPYRRWSTGVAHHLSGDAGRFLIDRNARVGLLWGRSWCSSCRFLSSRPGLRRTIPLPVS